VGETKLKTAIHTVESPLDTAWTNFDDSMVQERTVSVLPSLNSRVMDASYVRQNLPAS